MIQSRIEDAHVHVRERVTMTINMDRRAFVGSGLAASALAALAGCKKQGPAAANEGQGSEGAASTAGGKVFRYYIRGLQSCVFQ